MEKQEDQFSFIKPGKNRKTRRQQPTINMREKTLKAKLRKRQAMPVRQYKDPLKPQPLQSSMELFKSKSELQKNSEFKLATSMQLV